MKKLNQWIINNFEQYILKLSHPNIEGRVAYRIITEIRMTSFALIAIHIFSLSTALIIYNLQDIYWNFTVFISLLILPLFIIISLLFFEIRTYSLTGLFKLNLFTTILIHSLLPNRDDREQEVRHFIDTQVKICPEVTNETPVIKKKSPLLNLLENFSTNLEELALVLDRNETNFIKFLKEQKKDYSYCQKLNNTHSSFLGFIFFSLIIPRNVSLDASKNILKSNRINDLDRLLAKFDDFDASLFTNGFDSLFENYSETKIVRLFSHNYNPNSYMNIIKVCKNFNYKLPLFNNIEELNSFCQNNQSAFSQNIYQLEQVDKLPKLKRIENKSLGDLTFKVLGTVDDLHFWGNTLRHCIKGYFEKCHIGNCFLIGVYYKGKEYANVEINKSNKVVQINGFQNKTVEKHQYIKDYIENFLEID